MQQAVPSHTPRFRENYHRSECGTALVEFSVYVPLFVFLAIATFELGMFMHREYLISRVASNVVKDAFRSCSFYNDQPGDCLRQEASEFLAQLGSDGEELQVTLTMWGRDVETGNVVQRGGVVAIGGSAPSQYDLESVDATFGDIISPFKNLVIAECFAPRGVFRYIAGGSVYETAAM